MAGISLDQIEKTYPNGHVAVRGLDLEIADGEFVVLVGPSGCGKSTTLRMIAGLETPTTGKIAIGEQDVTSLPPQDRDLAMVFQSYALYPHMTVQQNMEFGLRMRMTSPNVICDRVSNVAGVLGLGELLTRKPAQLSGGQRQRVALGRAMVREPRAFLLDEPLSNLDAKLRIQTRAELARMHRQLGATMIYVTHDQEEAMTLGDRIAVMHDGRLQQVAPPLEIYLRPANAFVAGFVGSPSMNFFPSTLKEVEGRLRLESPWFSLSMNNSLKQRPQSLEVTAGIRPHDLQLTEPTREADITARVDVIQPLGADVVVHLRVPGQEERELSAIMVVPASTKLQVDEQIGVRINRERLHLFDAVSGSRIG